MNEKFCRHCRQTKPVSEFYQWPGKQPSISAHCKPCTKERVRARELAKPEQVRATRRLWEERNKEKLSAYQAERRERPGEREKAKERVRRWREDNPQRERDNHIRKHYGLPRGSYEKMLEEQNGKCAICEATKPGGKGRFHIDHCHSKGSVRGLLCHNCNILLGHSKDDPDILRKAITYLMEGITRTSS